MLLFLFSTILLPLVDSSRISTHTTTTPFLQSICIANISSKYSWDLFSPIEQVLSPKNITFHTYDLVCPPYFHHFGPWLVNSLQQPNNPHLIQDCSIADVVIVPFFIAGCTESSIHVLTRLEKWTKLLEHFVSKRKEQLPYWNSNNQQQIVFVLSRVIVEWMQDYRETGAYGVAALKLLSDDAKRPITIITVEADYNRIHHEFFPNIHQLQIPYSTETRVYESNQIDELFPIDFKKKTLLVSSNWNTRIKAREILLTQCHESPHLCQHLECIGSNELDSSQSTSFRLDSSKLNMQSIFCLQPHGDTPSRSALYDCILHGTIPVVFDMHYPFAFHDYLPWTGMTIFIPLRTIQTCNIIHLLEYLNIHYNNYIQSTQKLIMKYRRVLQYALKVDFQSMAFNETGVTNYDDAATFTMKILLGRVQFSNATWNIERKRISNDACTLYYAEINEKNTQIYLEREIHV